MSLKMEARRCSHFFEIGLGPSPVDRVCLACHSLRIASNGRRGAPRMSSFQGLQFQRPGGTSNKIDPRTSHKSANACHKLGNSLHVGFAVPRVQDGAAGA